MLFRSFLTQSRFSNFLPLKFGLMKRDAAYKARQNKTYETCRHENLLVENTSAKTFAVIWSHSATPTSPRRPSGGMWGVRGLRSRVRTTSVFACGSYGISGTEAPSKTDQIHISNSPNSQALRGSVLPGSTKSGVN